MKRQRKKLIAIVIALTLIVVGCSPGATPVPPTQVPPTQPPAAAPTATTAPQTKAADPETVLRAITDALNRKDAEAATALVADDVVQTLIPAPSGTGIYQTKEAMHARFKEVVAGNPIHKLTNCRTSGDEVVCDATYADDSTKPLGFDLEFTVDAVVQNGLLKTVTWKMTDASLTKMQAAMEPRPTATFEPEALATKSDDLAGVWLISHLLEGAGQAQFAFRPDGTYLIEGISGAAKGTPLNSGKYWFDGEQLKLESTAGCLTSQGDIVPCIAIYRAYVAKQGGKAVQLRLAAEDDQDLGRKGNLSGKMMPAVQQ